MARTSSNSSFTSARKSNFSVSSSASTTAPSAGSEADDTEREYWDDYLRAYEDALARCNCDDTPLFVIPADHKWFRDLAISEIIVSTMEAMNIQVPDPTVDIEEIRRTYHSAANQDKRASRSRKGGRLALALSRQLFVPSFQSGFLSALPPPGILNE